MNLPVGGGPKIGWDRLQPRAEQEEGADSNGCFQQLEAPGLTCVQPWFLVSWL